MFNSYLKKKKTVIKLILFKEMAYKLWLKKICKT